MKKAYRIYEAPSSECIYMYYKRRKKGGKVLFKEVTQNLLNLGRETNIQTQKTPQDPMQVKHKEPYIKTQHNSIVKNQDKKKMKVAREKLIVTYIGTHIRLSADFSTETLQTRREWDYILKVLETKVLYLCKGILLKWQCFKMLVFFARQKYYIFCKIQYFAK